MKRKLRAKKKQPEISLKAGFPLRGFCEGCDYGYNSYERGTTMRSVNIAELKNSLSKYVTFAREGEEIVIRDRNLPVAKLVPFSTDEASDEDLLLVAAGLMRMPQEPLKISELLKIATGTVSSNAGIQALLNDREEGL